VDARDGVGRKSPQAGSRRRSGAMLTVLLAMALGLAGCNDEDDSPSSSAVPDNAVAVVGDNEISGADLAKRVALLRRAQTQPSEAKQTDRRTLTQQLRRQALSTLIVAEALEQEASARGIDATTVEARERWEQVASRQFPTRDARRRFLGDRTDRDVVEQLRLQTLAERIHQQVAERAGGGKQGHQAVTRFQDEFRRRWEQRTTCRKGLDAAGCPARRAD